MTAKKPVAYCHIQPQSTRALPLPGPGDNRDGDAVLDGADVDDDNDGIPDVLECMTGLDPFGDANGNSVLNYQDNTMLDWVDVNGDGICDLYDTDRDGIINSYDHDSDGDGIPDVLEAGLPDVDDNARADGAVGANGAITTVPVGFTPRKTDSDPVPDFRDIDSDNDGITDNVEAQFTTQYRLPSGADADQDGIDDEYDKDINLLYTDQGIVPVNFQGAVDILPDYIDTDTDDDGISDLIEGHDADLNGVADFLPTGTDTDGDGLDNGFDLDNTGPNSRMVGMNAVAPGAFGINPPANPPGTLGARGPLQRNNSTDLDRTWRNIFIALPLTLVNFTAEKQDGKVVLRWESMHESNFREYVLERSSNGTSFTTVATIPGKGGTQAAYEYVDQWEQATAAKLYYRLKQVDKDDRFVYSRLLAVSLQGKSGIHFKITPNPAIGNITLSMASDKKTSLTIRVMDNLGRLLLSQRTGIVKGDNIIPLAGTHTLRQGGYTVMIQAGEERSTQKLLIQK